MNRSTFVRAIKVLLVAVVATPSVALAITAITQASALLGVFALFAGVPALAIGMGMLDRSTQMPVGSEFADATAQSDQFFAINDVNPRTGRDWSHYDARVSLSARTNPHQWS